MEAGMTHISARLPSDLVCALTEMGRQRERTFSQELRLAAARAVDDWVRKDDEPGGTGSNVGSSPMQAASDANGR